ncbi:MAG: hypothetical protein ACTHM6_10905 [Tepidisphaeraceae bacterium]
MSSDVPPAESPSPASPADSTPAPKKKHRKRRIFGTIFLLLVLLLVVGRLLLPRYVTWEVNRIIDRNPLYNGKIGGVTIALWKGEYSIYDVKLLKLTGNVPVPFFAAKRIDLAIQWDAILHGKIKGTVFMDEPQVNFVQDANPSQSQTGAGGPWLGIIQSLFPFDINSCQLHNGSVHFRAFDRQPQVDVYLSELELSIDNLSNIRDETKPLVSTITGTARAMDSGKVDLHISLDPFSYKPSFDLGLKLIGLDVSKVNNFALAYGGIDFEQGFFDLVVELKSREGAIDGTITPLFRDLQVLGKSDFEHDNPLNLFWQALVGGAEFLLKNQPRDQFGTRIPVTGTVGTPTPDVLTTLGNVLRNAFIRAYLPRFQGELGDSVRMDFKPGSVLEPGAPSMNQP